jgi:hypothetical protein
VCGLRPTSDPENASVRQRARVAVSLAVLVEVFADIAPVASPVRQRCPTQRYLSLRAHPTTR